MGIPTDDGNDIVVVTGQFKHATEKATLLVVDIGTEYWFPTSQLKKPSVLISEEGAEPSEWAIFVPKWLLKDKENCNYEEYDEEDWPQHQ